MRAPLVVGLVALAGAAHAYRCANMVCDFPNLQASDCSGYWHQALSPVKTKLKDVKDRDVLYNQAFNNCSSGTATTVEIQEEKSRQASVEVTTNNSRVLNLAGEVAVGVKDVLGAKTSMSTNATVGDGGKFTTTDTIKYLSKVSKTVNPYSKTMVVALTKSVSASGYKMTKRYIGRWGASGELYDMCTVVNDGSGQGAEREYTAKTPSHKCLIACTPSTTVE